jgi:succinyl-diaminopimelate desuccinylase
MGGRARARRWDACLVGEPTNPDQLGDMIKIGRRGIALGSPSPCTACRAMRAYPHLADNPVRGVLALTRCADASALRCRHEFPAVQSGGDDDRRRQSRHQRGPGQGQAAFNIRFNDTWTAETFKAEIVRRLDAAAARRRAFGPAVRRSATRSSGPSGRAMSS